MAASKIIFGIIMILVVVLMHDPKPGHKRPKRRP